MKQYEGLRSKTVQLRQHKAFQFQIQPGDRLRYFLLALECAILMYMCGHDLSSSLAQECHRNDVLWVARIRMRFMLQCTLDPGLFDFWICGLYFFGDFDDIVHHLLSTRYSDILWFDLADPANQSLENDTHGDEKAMRCTGETAMAKELGK